MDKSFLLGIPVVFFLMSSCSENKSNWSIAENSDGLLILENDNKVLFYQRSSKSIDGKFERSNYIHPLYGISGNELTEDFPEDHFHQRGIFWTWHQNYIGKNSVGDGWALENFIWDVKDVKTSITNNSLELNTEVFWKSPLWVDENGNQKSFAKETAKIEIFSKSENYRIVDYEIVITALEDSLSIGGSEDEKGYSGFSWRMKLPKNVKFEGKDGLIKPTKLALDAGAWINVSGSLSQNVKNEGVVVISHSSNPNWRASEKMLSSSFGKLPSSSKADLVT